MDDLEFNGIAPQGDEPINEPIPAPDAPQSPVEQPQSPGFYAWSGVTQPVQNTAPQKKESPFANSPYVTAAPQQSTVRPENPYTAPYIGEVPVRPQQSRPVPPPKPPKPILPVLSIIACGVVAAVLVGSLIVTNGQLTGLRQRLNDSANRIEQLEDQLAASQNTTVTRPQQTTATNDQPVMTPATGMMTPAQVYAQCVPSVVAINCTGTAYNGFGQYYSKTASSGSGFVLSEDGYIVTNYHVVEGSSSIEICMYDGTTYKAEYIGGNETNDIALVKVNAKNLPYVTIGSSSDLIVGDQVAAIGNPLGELAATLTVGYISAKDRIVTSEGTQINMLQTDAAINPGNSGGPLFNMYGEVVGITSAKYSGTTDSGATIEGIGFAIPTDDVMMMLEDLKNFGYVTGGYLGVTVSEVDQDTSQLYGLPQGVLVRDVMPGSCAEKAGMRSQDIIIDLGGNEVKNLNGLSRALNKCKAGQEVIVTVYRSGREMELTVILDERPQEEEKESQVQSTVPTDPQTPWPGDSYLEDWFGQFFG